MIKAFITSKIKETNLNKFKNFLDLKYFDTDKPLNKNEIIEGIKDVEILICFLYDNIDKQIIESAKNLKLIATIAVGFNNIDINYAKQKNIYVVNTPDVLTDATADLTFALILTTLRRTYEAEKFVRDRKFKGWQRDLFLGSDLKNLNLGIIGAGRIGYAVAKRALGFKMNLFYNSKSGIKKEFENINAKFLTFNELLKISDVISIHTPLNNETYHLLNDEAFSFMKKGIFIINTSRGQVIDEKIMIKYLQNGKIKGVGLDVYEFEPNISEELFEFDNVVLFPHIGSSTHQTRDAMVDLTIFNIIEYLSNKKPKNTVNI